MLLLIQELPTGPRNRVEQVICTQSRSKRGYKRQKDRPGERRREMRKQRKVETDQSQGYGENQQERDSEAENHVQRQRETGERHRIRETTRGRERRNGQA